MQDGQPVWLYVSGNSIAWVAVVCFYAWMAPPFMKMMGRCHTAPRWYEMSCKLRSMVKPIMWPVPIPFILSDAYQLYKDAIDQPWTAPGMGWLWYLSKLFLPLTYWLWWKFRNHDDDDDYWKRKRKQAKEAVKRVGSKLIVHVPVPSPA